LILEIVTTEETVYSGEVDIVIAPGVEGQLGILPRHAPLLTAVSNGEIIARNGSSEERIAVSGGFLEVSNDRVTILA
tara:strand:- start:520 stop:750 length:231 start_codon:yes stop_codon:yes gene_type:complete